MKLRKDQMTQYELLMAKVQCAAEARQYQKRDEEAFAPGGAYTSHMEQWAYSPRANTCVIYEQSTTKTGVRDEYITDLLTDRSLGMGSNGSLLGAWLNLFREANNFQLDTETIFPLEFKKQK